MSQKEFFVDLHIHTNYSDGIFTPEQVVEYASRVGLSAISITDHDTVDGAWVQEERLMEEWGIERTGRGQAADAGKVYLALNLLETGKAAKSEMSVTPGTGADADKAKLVEIEKGKQCYVRTAPNTEGRILGVAHSGDRMQYQGQTTESGWHLVVYKEQNAWVSGKYGKLVG